MAKIDCNYIAEQILNECKNKPKRGRLAIVMVGENPASEAYVRGKLKDAEKCNLIATLYRMGEETTEKTLCNLIVDLACDEDVAGIIVQLPLPKHINEEIVLDLIPSYKDVDGFGKRSLWKPCTPEAIIDLMEMELGTLEGRSVLLIGRGKLVGKPLIPMLINRDCTVTVAHSKTKGIKDIIEQWHDVIITGVGKPEAFNMMFANTSLVIDAGISTVDGKLKGDCAGLELGDFDYTTVPGGIGLLTRATLMRHLTK